MCRRCRTRAIIVRDQGTIFLGGPPLVKAATGEVVTRRGARRRRRAHAHLGRRRPSTRTTTRTRWRIARRIVGNLNRPQAAGARAAAGPREPLYDPEEIYGVVPQRPAQALRRARGDRAHRRRQRARRVQAALRHDAGHRLRAHLGLSGRHRRQQRHPVLRDRRSRARISSSSAASAASRWCSCRTSPASWSARSTRRAASPRTAPRW